MTWEEFQKDASAETEVSIRDIATQAEFTVLNNGSFEELNRELDAIIAQIR